MKIIQSEKTGIYSVRFRAQSGKTITRNLGTKNKKEALMLVKEAKIEELETAGRIGALQRDAIASIVADRNMPFQDCVHEWVEFSKVRARSHNTLFTQTKLIQAFAKRARIKYMSDITSKKISNYINEKSDVKLGSREQRLAAIRSIVGYAVANSYIIKDPSYGVAVDASKLSHQAKETNKRMPFSKKEYNLMVEEAPYFFKQAIMLGWWTGLRAIDVCKLEWASWDADYLTVHTEKTDTRVQLPLDNPMIGGGILREVVAVIDDNDSKYCFPDWADIISHTNRRSRFSLYFSRFLNRIGIEGKSFHCFRHSFVTRVQQDDYNSSIQKIAKWVGHSNLETTKGYLHETS